MRIEPKRMRVESSQMRVEPTRIMGRLQSTQSVDSARTPAAGMCLQVYTYIVIKYFNT
jgi:hypothetical protein